MVFHFSYHKCITVYYQRILNQIFDNSSKISKLRNRALWRVTGKPRGYKHFNSWVDRFYSEWPGYRAASLNNHSVDFAKLGNCRATHFIRDPRDLIVSGYFYHRRGAERWCRVIDPKPADFAIVNGCIPREMKSGMSFMEFLTNLDKESGLIAEMDFRKNHFKAMSEWDFRNPNCLELRYEEIIGNEAEVFDRIFDHYQLDERRKQVGLLAAEYHSAKNQQGRISHIRNPTSGQWQKYFTSRLEDAFQDRFPGLLERTGY